MLIAWVRDIGFSGKRENPWKINQQNEIRETAGYTQKILILRKTTQKAPWTLITVPWTSMKRDSSSLWIFDSVYEIIFRVYGCRVVIFIGHPSSGHALTRGLLFSVSKGRARGGTDTIGPVKAFVMWNPCCTGPWQRHSNSMHSSVASITRFQAVGTSCQPY